MFNCYKVVCKFKEDFNSEILDVKEVYIKNIKESILVFEEDVVIFYKNKNNDFSNDYIIDKNYDIVLDIISDMIME